MYTISDSPQFSGDSTFKPGSTVWQLINGKGAYLGVSIRFYLGDPRGPFSKSSARPRQGFIGLRSGPLFTLFTLQHSFLWYRFLESPNSMSSARPRQGFIGLRHGVSPLLHPTTVYFFGVSIISPGINLQNFIYNLPVRLDTLSLEQFSFDEQIKYNKYELSLMLRPYSICIICPPTARRYHG
jgi:hypothetical protein